MKTATPEIPDGPEPALGDCDRRGLTIAEHQNKVREVFDLAVAYAPERDAAATKDLILHFQRY
eukprot:CAMPEP_0175132610 /NCGR_PEP_ID=MMETSP0087-20121206/7164_1 /TAXON_ID=136419 /ORGANISM="Unknown Unknown, Strain D1" /LENGTH=62 /DNA_ID=CAMNT_0016414971 /DNA_START=399 /DNA_END=588 /DNA_ORIENTATION=+